MNPFVQGDYLGACRHIEKAYNAVKEIANDTVNLQKSHPINKVLRHLTKAIESCSDWGDDVGMHARFHLLGNKEVKGD